MFTQLHCHFVHSEIDSETSSLTSSLVEALPFSLIFVCGVCIFVLIYDAHLVSDHCLRKGVIHFSSLLEMRQNRPGEKCVKYFVTAPGGNRRAI